VLPTYLVVALEPGRPATLEPTRQLRGVLRLDQTAALFELLKAAQRGEPSPEEGSHRIRQIVDMGPRFGASVTILGHVVLTVGICLILQQTWGDLALAALFGALVAVFKRGCQVASGRSRRAGLTVWNGPHSSFGMTAPGRSACRPTTKCRSEADDGQGLAAYRRWHTNRRLKMGCR
jgi:hypothetical protein